MNPRLRLTELVDDSSTNALWNHEWTVCYNSRRTYERPPQPPVRVLVCFISCHAMDYSASIRSHANVCQFRSYQSVVSDTRPANRMLATRCPVIDVHSDFTIPAFNRHFTILWRIEMLLGNTTILENRSSVFYLFCAHNNSASVFSVRWVRAKWL
jgi:hypothetical protein